MGFVVNNTKDIPNLWDAEAEALIALLAKNLEKRGFKKEDVVRDLNFKYLRKRKTQNKKNYGKTLLQDVIINNRGY